MKTEEIKKNKTTVEIVEADNLREFFDYITTAETNEAFKRSGNLDSHDSSEYFQHFAGTASFTEAVGLLKNGWTEEAKKLTQKLKAIENETMVKTNQKPCLSVAGYQPVVPLYLQGVPNNMVNKKMVPVKQKVVTINKMISYPSMITKEKIEEESIKSLQIIKKLESQGIRCNLDIIAAMNADNKDIMAKIRIKSANEKLNISKVAFPLIHPSMLRRLIFRFIETYPSFTSGFTFGYGRALKPYEVQQNLKNVKRYEKEYLIPNVLKQEVNCLEDLGKLLEE